MSANFNIAMLRSIQQPLAESMEAIIAQLTRMLAGQIQGAELDQGQHSKLVRGSLEMIGCQAISRLASTLEKGCEALTQPERRGWDRSRVEEVSKSLLLLAEGLDDQIKHMLVDNEDLPVRMWPVWAHVYEAMGEPVPTPEDLFEPDPNFEDEKFQPLATDYLAQVCEGMSERLSQSISQLDAARDGNGVAKALREAERVFNWAYGLRHRRGYQAYWLVMRARMAMGLIQDPALLEDKASWTILLNEASIELQKFSKDALRVRPDLLLKVIRPLLAPWPQSWTNAHPALAEMDARMGLSVFWKTVLEVQDQKSQLAITQFVAHQDELLALLASVRSEWTRYVSGEGRSSDASTAKDSMVQSLRALSSKRMLFADPSAIVMLDELGRLADSMPHFEAITEDMSLEFASSVLVVEDSVERRGRFSPEFHEQSRTQQKRLTAAWSGNGRELAALPMVRWDAKKQERQTRQAMSTVFQEIRKDLVGVEEILVEHFREEHGKPLDRDAMRDTLSLADAVLRMLLCEPASRVVKALIERVPSIPTQGSVDQTLQDEITLGVTGLTSFLAARESGDEDAENLLSSAVKALLNEPLRRGKDPSLMVPPPESEVDHVALHAEVAPQNHVEPELNTAPVVHEEALDLSFDFDLGPTAEAAEAAIVPAEPVDIEPLLSPSKETLPAKERSEDEISIQAQNGVWDYPSEKEPDLVYFLLDEADAVLAEIETQAGILDHEPSNEEARASLRRQFHTIKGSGRIAGLFALAQVAYWMEDLLTLDEQESPIYRRRVDMVVRSAHQQFETWFQELRQNSKVWIEALELRQQIETVVLMGFAQNAAANTSIETGDIPMGDTLQDEGQLQDAPLHEPSPQELDFEFTPSLQPSPLDLDVPSVEIQSEDAELPEITPSPELELSPPDGVELVATQNEAADADAEAIFEPYPEDALTAQLVEDVAAQSQDVAEAAEEEASSERMVDEASESEAGQVEEVFAEEASVVVVPGLGEMDAEMFSLFRQDAIIHVEAIRSCVSEYESAGEVDVSSLARAAHTLASLAGGLGAHSIRQLARSIEKTLDVNPEDPPPASMPIPAVLASASAVLADAVEKLYAEHTLVHVPEETIILVDSLLRAPGVEQVDNAYEESMDPVDLTVEDTEDDALIDDIIDKMAEVAERLQEATLLLIKLSERRR